ncbi:DUF4244 domain-containing protein [Sinomonas sp. R1AF57]|jgi:hypothetical protein|uniref:DUF4244 domain-containing protein n=1 Tax=Sinomonas sp. R1AF57 TaxID=2020377 RepID=UPI002101CF0C|nr:DUF4244 domain-containing protein [Sinomonas sp. R1AF57]
MSTTAMAAAWLDPSAGPAPEALPRSESIRTKEPLAGSASLPVHAERLAQVVELYPATGRRRPDGAPRRSGRPVRRRWSARLQRLARGLARRMSGQAGMATAEYAIATLGAVAFAGLLVVIMRSDEVRGFLLGIIRAALALP